MKRGLLISFICVGFLVFQQLNFACASELTDDYFDIATNYFNTNNYAKAIEYLDNIIKLENKFFKYYFCINQI